MVPLNLLRVLQGILAAKLDPEPAVLGKRKAEAAVVTRIAADDSLQLSLLNCAAELVSFACERDGVSFPRLTCALDRLNESAALWHAADLFRHHLSASSLRCALPESVAILLGYMRFDAMLRFCDSSCCRRSCGDKEHLSCRCSVRIAEELIWINGSSLFSLMNERADQEQTALLEAILVSVSRLAASRVRAAAAALRDAIPEFGKIFDDEGECLRILDALLVPNLDLLFNQHISNLVACCVYSAAKCVLFFSCTESSSCKVVS